MREDGDASDKPLDVAVLTRMKQFRAMNKLKKVALKVDWEYLLVFIIVIPTDILEKLVVYFLWLLVLVKLMESY